VEKARAGYESELAELAREVESADAELRNAQRVLLEAQAHQAVAETDKESLTGTRLLRAFLKDRSESADYQSYLGVVALAHRDLRDLAEFMQEATRGRGSELDRIILYVDDLDRCEPQTVADVLSAIHLLLAFPLFVVVVGVSPHWLERSLTDRHGVLLSPNADLEGRQVTASDYLEKIFQLTYTLRPIEGRQAGQLLTGMALDSTLGPSDSPTLGPPILWEESTVSERVPSAADLATALTIQEAELRQLDAVGPLVSTSPRRAQRFLNLYLVLRARFAASDSDAQALLLTTAIAMGVPKSLAAYLRAREGEDWDGNTGVNAISLIHHEFVAVDESLRWKNFILSAAEVTPTLSDTTLIRWLHDIWCYLPLGFQPDLPDAGEAPER
jgi:hypothetical protein